MEENDLQGLAEALLLQSVFASRNELFAQKAAHENRLGTARFYRALAKAESVHVHKALMLLRGKAQNTENNLAQTLEDLEDAAAVFASLAESTDGPASDFLRQFSRTSRNHVDLLAGVGDNPDTPYHVCTVCGFIAKEAIPERCPVCQAVSGKFDSPE